MAGALSTDLYELTMAVSYLRRGMVAPATFSLFVRDLPSDRGYLVAAGLADCLDHLESFRFTGDEVEHVADLLALTPSDRQQLRELRFTGDVWAVPEGTVVTAGEPLVEVTAPIAEAQLVETALLNFVTFQTGVASKAARCRTAAPHALLIDFSMRRTQSLQAAEQVARATAITGFDATSNVAAARRFGLRATGTMAHSYVEAFGSEHDAFLAFATDFPRNATFLVDTYDTLDGVRAAIEVIRGLGLGERAGIRLDSGDLAALSIGSRALLDHAGLNKVRIFASGGLDEHAVDSLVRADAPIDGYGIGTKLGVCADAPYLDTAYKLVEYDGRPMFKRSTGKATAPGAKQVFRAPGTDDRLGLRGQSAPAGTGPVLRQVMTGGHRLEDESLDVVRQRCAAELATLAEDTRRLHTPTRLIVVKTAELLAYEASSGFARRGASSRSSAAAAAPGSADQRGTGLPTEPQRGHERRSREPREHDDQF